MIQIKTHDPNYFFLKIDNDLLSDYNEGFSLGDIFKVRGKNILTGADELLVNTKLDKLKENIEKYMNGKSNIEVGEFTKKQGIDLNGTYKILPYRAFDNRYYYSSRLINTKSLLLTKHESIENNYYLSFCSSAPDNDSFSHLLVTKSVPECKIFKGKKAIHSAPLYVYNKDNYYLNFKSTVFGNEKFSHIYISKNVADNAIFTGQKPAHSAPLYIINEQNKGQI